MPSTAISQAFYDPHGQVLHLTFVTGRRYRYYGVPAAVAEGFAAARSKGGYFNRRIRDRYDFDEVESDGDEN